MEKLINRIVKRVIKEATAYHGSDADFSDFDLAFVNTGAKNQAYGYGVYLSYMEDGIVGYGKNKYIVEIPSDDKKYIEGDKYYKSNFLKNIQKKLYNAILKYDDTYTGSERELWQDLNSSFENEINGELLYGTIESYFGSDKYAAELLYSWGFIGLRYDNNGYKNVVMFNPKDIKIIKRE